MKILCALYADPKEGYPPKYSRTEIPKIETYANGQTVPNPKGLGFTPGELVGCVSGGLGLKSWLESLGHEFIVTDDKDGADSFFEKHLPDADVVISQPFWPVYMTKERFEKAKNLKLIVTAGIGSDHTDLAEAVARKIDVVEVTGSNCVGVIEHQIMSLLALVRNFIPSHEIAASGGWNIADCVSRSYDLEGMDVGTIGAGRIGLGALRRLQPFGVKLHYTDQWRQPPEVEAQLGLTYHADIKEMVRACDAVLVNCPLHPGTERLFNRELIRSMRPGSYIVNTARGKIIDTDALVEALNDGHIAGYAGDVWFPQPAPKDHPWRTMPNNAMVPHISGTSLSGQARYAAGTREILECFFEGRPYRPEYLIVKDGALAGAGAHAYKPGNTTGGAELKK